MPNLLQLKQTTEQIRDEVNKGANTATKVGQAMTDQTTAQIEQISETGNIPVALNGHEVRLNKDQSVYYGGLTKLDIGVYDRVEIPYYSATWSSGTGYAYLVILDQDDNQLAYQRVTLDGTSNFNASEGTFVIDYTNFVVEAVGYYQVVLGFRGLEKDVRDFTVFAHKLSGSSDRYWKSQDAALQVDDASGVDFSAITKNTTNKVIQTLNYFVQ